MIISLEELEKIDSEAAERNSDPGQQDDPFSQAGFFGLKTAGGEQDKGAAQKSNPQIAPPQTGADFLADEQTQAHQNNITGNAQGNQNNGDEALDLNFFETNPPQPLDQQTNQQNPLGPQTDSQNPSGKNLEKDSDSWSRQPLQAIPPSESQKVAAPPQPSMPPINKKQIEDLIRQQIEDTIRQQSRELIEKAVWKVVPELAKEVIATEVRRLLEERKTKAKKK